MKNLITTILFTVITSFAIAQGSLDSGLVAFYPFNGNANDESGNANNPTFIGSGVTLTADRFGNANKAYYFDGNTDSYIRIPADNFPTTDRTISFWFNANQMENHPTPLSYGGDVCNNSVLMTFNKGGYPNAYTLLSHCGSNFLSAPYLEAPINNWYYFTLTISGATQKIFINGELQNTENTFSTPTFVAGKSAILGALLFTDGNTVYVDPTAGYFQGKLDDFRFYNGTLTDLEVHNLYNREANGAVAYYPFNGNANDESGNSYNGNVSGATLATDRFNQSEKAYNFIFNGFSSDKIEVSGTSGINFSSGGFSISAWIKFSGPGVVGNNYPIFSKHICGEQSGYILMLYNDKLTFWLAGTGGYNVLSTPDNYTDNSWHQVVAVYDDLNQYIYVDGLLKNSVPFIYSVYNSANWALGGYNGCNGGFNGKVDEIKIHHRPLSAVEILEEYNNTVNDLVLFLPFNGNSNDESGNNNNGTVNGASLTQDRFGVNGQAYGFDGIDDHITIADNPNLFSDEMTISCWYKMTEILGGERVVIGWVDGGHRYQQFFNGGQLSYLNGYNVAQPGTYFNPIYGLNDLNIWKHVVVTYKKLGASTSTTSIYVDGELKQTDNHTLAMDYAPGPDFFIGKNHNGNYFNGYFDDLRIFNRNLNASEILALYHDSSTYNPPLEDGLVAYWPFDGNTDDSTSFNNDGINYNGVFSKDRYGNDNTSIFFNAVDSYVEGINPGNSLPVGNSPRTFSAWIRNNQYNQYGCNIFHYGTQQAAPTNFHFLITDVLGLGNGYGYGVVYGNTNLNDSTWHFVTGVYEGGTERTTKLYIDGKLDATGAITTEPNTVLTNNWRMGRFMEGSSNFNGNIDELKVYDIPLTNQQVWDIYKATTTAPNLIYPQDDSTLINPTMIGLVLDWDSTVTATGYRFLLANDSLFNSVIHDTIVNASSFNFYDWFSVNIDNLYWKVRTINDGGTGPWSETNRFNIMLTDVEDETQLPTEFALMQNYPNPFNPTTTIAYHLPNTSKVQLKVYDVLGNEIATLVNEEKSSGIYNVQLTMNNVSSGIYFYKITAGDFVQTKKMILVK